MLFLQPVGKTPSQIKTEFNYDGICATWIKEYFINIVKFAAGPFFDARYDFRNKRMLRTAK